MGCDDFGDTAAGTGAPGYMETGDDMGKPNIDAAADLFEQHKKYQKNKLEEHGYPGLGPTTSQADVIQAESKMPGMWGIAEGGNNAYPGGGGQLPNPLGIAGITRSLPMYKPHKFQPSQHGLIGAPCMICGGLPGGPVHDVEPDPLPVGQIRVQAIDDKVAGCIRIEVDNAPNEVSRRVLLQILPDLLELYLNKSKDYGDDEDTGDDLGPKGPFVDMFRKMKKLRRALWDGVELEGEGPEEIMQDLVGHIFIILDKMARESHGG